MQHVDYFFLNSKDLNIKLKFANVNLTLKNI